jgi:steroid delta-isomerase-like uncharacterized protein
MTTNFQALSWRAIPILLLCAGCFPAFGQTTNKKTVIRYFDEVINTQKLDRIGEFFSKDYIWHQMNGTDSRRDQDSAHVSILRWLFRAIPDVHYAIDHIIAEGDVVALNTTVTGTAKTEMFGLVAAQKKVRFKSMFFYRLKEGKITEEWEVVDLAFLNEQLSEP